MGTFMPCALVYTFVMAALVGEGPYFIYLDFFSVVMVSVRITWRWAS